MPDALSGLPRTEVKIGGRKYRNVGDRDLVALLTAASWVLQRLPGQVLEEQRGELVKTLADARYLVVEVHCGPAVILARDGDRPRAQARDARCTGRIDARTRARRSRAEGVAGAVARHAFPALETAQVWATPWQLWSGQGG